MKDVKITVSTTKANEQASSLSSLVTDLASTKLTLLDAVSALTQLRLAAQPPPQPSTSTARTTTATTVATGKSATKTQAAGAGAPAPASPTPPSTSSSTTTASQTSDTTEAARIARYQALSQTLARTKATINNAPQTSTETFVIQGLFVNELGQPRADCSLVATDAGDVLSSKVNPQRANADGYATLTLRAQEFPSVVNGSVPIFLSVVDGTGSQVYAPNASITPKAGTVAIFRATIPGQPAPVSSPTSPASPPSTPSPSSPSSPPSPPSPTC